MMVDVPKPPKRNKGKGAPPNSETLSTVMGNNTEKPEREGDVPMNLRVPAEFHRRVKQFSLDHDISVKQATIKALEELMLRMGTPK